eukprot:6208689-Amphidinium_carterae.5
MQRTMLTIRRVFRGISPNILLNFVGSRACKFTCQSCQSARCYNRVLAPEGLPLGNMDDWICNGLPM